MTGALIIDIKGVGVFHHKFSTAHQAESGANFVTRITSYNVCYTKLLRGGATSTTTVDVSDTYLTRAQANLALNGFGGPLHQMVEADCLEWLKQTNDRFGVIFLDPPTFSNARHP